MQFKLSADLQPTVRLPFEPCEAQVLTWLPLAVRYKLDQASLKLPLKAWQRLPREDRERLLALPAGSAFEAHAVSTGAFHKPSRERIPSTFVDYVSRKVREKHARTLQAYPEQCARSEPC